MQWILYVLPGVAVAVAAYLVYVAATKGVPAAAAKAKAWWTKGKQDLSAVRGDVASAHQRLDKLEADVAALKGQPAPAAAAPASA